MLHKVVRRLWFRQSLKLKLNKGRISMARTKEEALERIRILIQTIEREGVDDNGIAQSIQRLIEGNGVEKAKSMVEMFGIMFQSDPGKRQIVDNLLREIF
jgi:hypothetical protein